MSYPGERATIDGGLPYFRQVPNHEWTLINPAIQLYRSNRTIQAEFVRGWLIDDDVQLVDYRAPENLQSTHYAPLMVERSLYMGPGLQLRPDGYIDIRLQYNPTDLTDAAGNPLTPTPSDTNPNHNKIAIFTSENIFILNGAAYLRFKDLDFSYARRIIDARAGSHHIEIDGCTFNYGSWGVTLRDDSHDWEIHHSQFNNGLPDYVYWRDIKGSYWSAEAQEFQSNALTGAMSGFQIHHNLFRDTFDGMIVHDYTSNLTITDNLFVRTHDDAINLLRGVSNVEVAYNVLWHVASGISNLGSEAPPGQVYIHHNVIDNTGYSRGGRPGDPDGDYPVWHTINPFGSHGNGDETSWWKIYNNTIVTRKGGNPTAVVLSAIHGNPQKYVYNNIFFVLDDRTILRGDPYEFGSKYDGNVYYRQVGGNRPLFREFGNNRDYASLAQFRSESGTDWEIHGLESDPGFDLAALAGLTFDPATVDLATIRELYRPSSCLMYTPGAAYEGLDWPGTTGVTYRGALPPDAAVIEPLALGNGTAVECSMPNAVFLPFVLRD
jgi:hypothetical protein